MHASMHTNDCGSNSQHQSKLRGVFFFFFDKIVVSESIITLYERLTSIVNKIHFQRKKNECFKGT